MLIALAALSFVATSIFMPFWYPPALPVIGPGGAVVHGPDGKVLLYRDLTQFNKEAIPGEVFFLCFLICTGWLLIRVVRLLHESWHHKHGMG